MSTMVATLQGGQMITGSKMEEGPAEAGMLPDTTGLLRPPCVEGGV